MSTANRTLVYFIFAYTCVEGLIVNITYPNVVPYVIKDIAILMIYLGLLSESRPPVGSLRKIGGAIATFAIFVVFAMALPTQVSVLAALVAVKQRLFYIPLVYVAYFFVRTERDVVAMVKMMAWTAIPTALFGVYLFFQGPSALRSLGGTYSAVFYSTSGASGLSFWRVPGSFTSPGQYGLYLLMHVVVFTGTLFVPTIEKRTRLLIGLALGVSLAAMLVSGSRAPLVIYGLCTGIGLFYMGRLSRIGVAALIIYGVMSIAFTYFGAGVQDRVGSVLSEENIQRFQQTAFGQVFYSQLMSYPLGVGIGMATIAGRHFTDYAKIIFVESYFGVIVVEMGIIGLLIWISLIVRIAILLIRDRTFIKPAPWSPLWFFLVVLVLAIIGFMPSSNMIDSAPGNMYFWFLIGVAVRLADLWRARQMTRPGANASVPAPVPAFAFQPPGSNRV